MGGVVWCMVHVSVGVLSGEGKQKVEYVCRKRVVVLVMGRRAGRVVRGVGGSVRG